MADQLLIGQFAEMTGISSRMLRHYEKIGLIGPDSINPNNGYRYYSPEQLSLVKTILLLQDYGFTLSEIKSLQDRPVTTEAFLIMLKDKELTIRNRMDQDAGHLIKIKKAIHHLQYQPAPGLTEQIQVTELDLERSHPMIPDTSKNKDFESVKRELASLPTTALFMELVEERILTDPDTPKAFITFDIDRFAPVNENYGYDVGDRVIFQYFRIIMEIYQPFIDDGHALISRFGGDEISIYHTGIDSDDVVALANRTLESIRFFDFTELGCPQKITGSCGIYTFRDVTHIQECRHESSSAFMDAKRLGGNRVVVRKQDSQT